MFEECYNKARKGSVMKSKKYRPGFTLIELIVVISIILLLATITIPMLVQSRYTAKKAMIRAEIVEMERGLALYELDYGCYPPSEPGNSSQALVNALKGDPGASPPKKPYFSFQAKRLRNGVFFSLLDMPYYYRENQSKTNKTSDMKKPFEYDIWTDDPKNKDRDDEINNWE